MYGAPVQNASTLPIWRLYGAQRQLWQRTIDNRVPSPVQTPEPCSNWMTLLGGVDYGIATVLAVQIAS